ncbi:unnamed protein product [Strongylus vulgaris]|uniref:RING-type domain-containing protein n=1 Tax=Strongylus vulgaris TaxID=40348 RepID=A0A3P7KE95_STRVU|nr:unnamed protein product [Strongylus vulgaris]
MQRLEVTDGAASLKAYISKNEGKVRECPAKGCGAVIEKGEGCFHMQCSMCKIHFCWLCDFMSDTQSKVYGHLREDHGAIGAEWPAVEFVQNFGIFPRRLFGFLDADDIPDEIADDVW